MIRFSLTALVVLILTICTMTAHAGIPAHCDAQARELTMTASSEIMPDMSAAQRQQLRELALEICARHSTATTTTAADTPDDEDKSDDWFTDYILNGEPADKPGNRRLERRGR